MSRHTLRSLVALAAAVVVCATAPAARATRVVPERPAATVQAAAAKAALPERLTNQEFWRLSQESSEADGFFQSDNLVSNEIWFQVVIPELLERVPSGGVYVGVGPEQNFTYIAAVKPRMVFITDVRRGNLHMHLMYKALFELAKDRAGFVELLFNKRRPASLTDKASATELINGFWDVYTSAEPVYKANAARLLDHLTKTRELPLSQADRDGIENVYWQFYWYGPAITYSSSTAAGRGNSMPSYGDLIVTTDANSVARHFLANEALFRVLKDLHARNLIVPVVGNFAGPKALRAVGRYVREHGATIDVMYLSNVEQYLRRDGLWYAFCGNVAAMPLTPRSTFIRSEQSGGGPGSRLVNRLGAMLEETRGCGQS